MFRRSRPIDPDFDPLEDLYIRCRLCDVIGNRLSGVSIRFPDCSVNRGKHSEPEDVLIPHWLDFGIATFKVVHVPQSLTSESGTKFEFKVTHVPEDDNYAHSEIRTFKNGFHDGKVKVSSLVRKEFRQILSERTTVIRQPTI